MWVVFWGRVGKIPVGRTFKGLYIYVVGVSVVKGRENLAVSAELEGGGGVE